MIEGVETAAQASWLHDIKRAPIKGYYAAKPSGSQMAAPLPKLISGDLRVEEAERVVGTATA